MTRINTTPLGSHPTNNDFYNHSIPSGLSQEIQTSEANAQMLMQAVLKEAFEGKQEESEGFKYV